MTCPDKIVERNIGVDARKINREVKKKWIWDWLLEKDMHRDYLSENAKIVDQASIVICSWYNEFLIYGFSGNKRLLKRAVQCEKKTHTMKTKNLRKTPDFGHCG